MGRRTDPKTGTRTLCQPAQSTCTWTFHKSHYVQDLQVKCHRPRLRTTLCASLRSRNAPGHFTKAISARIHMKIAGAHHRDPHLSLHSRNAPGHFAKAILRENLHEKCRGPRSRPTLCASLRSRNALGHCTNENLQVKCCRHLQTKIGDHTFARACAVEMHLDIAQEAFDAIIYT